MTKLIAFFVASATFLAAAPAFAEPVNGRLANQHARIDAGVRDGQLTHREARHLRREDRAIHAEEHAMRVEHGGRLTWREHRQLERQENHVSRQIHRDRARGR